ncbi:MAG: hypothetical protein IKE53_09720 [Clostridiales bacterium]|nr:hypothetical protein [Clostridiales bacterium]
MLTDSFMWRVLVWQILPGKQAGLPLFISECGICEANRDYGVLPHLWQNIAHRVARTSK